jgi:hypothetical protein
VTLRYVAASLALIVAWFVLAYCLTKAMLLRLQEVICDPWAVLSVVFAYTMAMVASIVVLLVGLVILEVVAGRSNAYIPEAYARVGEKA